MRGGRAGATRGNGAELGRVLLAEWRRAERAARPHARGFSSAGGGAGRRRDGGMAGGAGRAEGCRELEFVTSALGSVRVFWTRWEGAVCKCVTETPTFPDR